MKEFEEIVGDLAKRARSSRALVLGAGHGPVAASLEEVGADVERVDVAEGDWPSVQLTERFEIVVVEPATPRAVHDLVAMVHCGVQHMVPGGLLVTSSDAGDTTLAVSRFALEHVDSIARDGTWLSVHQRTVGYTIHDMVFDARARIERVTAPDLAARLVSDSPPHVLDTRTHTDRHRSGAIPGSLHVPRTVLEWHLDPSNGYRHPAVISFDEPMVIVCNGGYSSSLAAANLADLGFADVGDLIGGHRAWLAAGLPVEPPDHSHLDL